MPVCGAPTPNSDTPNPCVIGPWMGQIKRAIGTAGVGGGGGGGGGAGGAAAAGAAAAVSALASEADGFACAITCGAPDAGAGSALASTGAGLGGLMSPGSSSVCPLTIASALWRPFDFSATMSLTEIP